MWALYIVGGAVAVGVSVVAGFLLGAHVTTEVFIEEFKQHLRGK